MSTFPNSQTTPGGEQDSRFDRRFSQILDFATEVFAEKGGKEQMIALLTATLMAIEGREGIAD